MKKTILLLLLCTLLASCAPAQSNAPQESVNPVVNTSLSAAPTVSPTPSPAPTPPPLMSEAEYPRVDGSTATIPLGAALLSRACAIPVEEAELYVSHSKTMNAYLNLMNEQCDLLLAYEPPEGVRDAAKDRDMDFDKDILMAPIGRDALVFLTNTGNAVDSLTGEQIVSIYQNEIANWSQVGGADAEIVAFQRDADSGSQTLMKLLAMKGEPMAEAPMGSMVSGMGELIETILEYDNGANSLGYSVYYYVKNMIGNPDLKLLAVDGIEPGDDTIGDGSYPYTNDFYAVIRSDEPADSPARKLYEYLLSDDGKDLISRTGYVTISTAAD